MIHHYLKVKSRKPRLGGNFNKFLWSRRKHFCFCCFHLSQLSKLVILSLFTQINLCRINIWVEFTWNETRLVDSREAKSRCISYGKLAYFLTALRDAKFCANEIEMEGNAQCVRWFTGFWPICENPRGGLWQRC